MGCRCPLLSILHVMQFLFSLGVIAITGDIAHKFAEARSLADKFEDLLELHPPIPAIVNHLLKTPIRIYIALAVGIWAAVVALLLIFVPRVQNSKYAPRALIILLETFTMVAWFGASIALALCAAEIEPICYIADAVPVVKKLVENCLILEIGTAFAAISGLLWFITSITACVQGYRSPKKRYQMEK